jgi:putative ABC transport system substrate-binding protein
MRVFSRKWFVSNVFPALFFCSVSVAAQQPKVIPRIGVIPFSGEPSAPGPAIEAFEQALRNAGYIPGKNIEIGYRWPLGRLDQIPALVTELLQVPVDVLVVGPQPAIAAAKKSGRTIPIVMISSVDPVAAGHVETLARPGGNVTGVALLQRDLSAKRIELLKEIMPRMTRLGILWDRQGPGPAVAFKEYEAAAREFKLDLQSLHVSGPNPELETTLKTAKESRRDALVVVSNPLIRFLMPRIIELTTLERLPSMHEDRVHVENGGLLSYGTSGVNAYRRVATYVDKILKGAKPADLPVEQLREFEVAINLKTARQIGIMIPPNVLARADRVIR